MPEFASPLSSLLHPHQIEVQEFDSYALVIDARPPAEYEEDHLPGAVNLPVVPLAIPSSVATGVLGDSSNGSGRRLEGVPEALAAYVSRLSPDDRVLVYCHRGGLDSVVWAEPLRAAGWSVDVLPGGWPNYRRWVAAGLEVLPRGLSFRVLQAPPLSGIERLLAALEFQGHQVLDLLALTGQRLVPGVLSRADRGVSQAAFESAVLRALRRYTPDRDVWVNELVVHPEDSLALPSTLAQQLRHSPAVRVLVPAAQRSHAWQQNLNASKADLDQVVSALCALPAAPTKTMTAHWQKAATREGSGPALTAIIEEFIDPRYDRLSAECAARPIECTLEIDSLVPLRGRAPAAIPELAAALATPSH